MSLNLFDLNDFYSFLLNIELRINCVYHIVHYFANLCRLIDLTDLNE